MSVASLQIKSPMHPKVKTSLVLIVLNISGVYIMSKAINQLSRV